MNGTPPAKRDPADAEMRSTIVAEGLTRASNRASGIQLVVTAALPAAVAAAAVATSSPWWRAAAFTTTTAALISANFIVHEAVHSSLFTSKRANVAAGTLAGAASFIPFAAYRTYHLEHHRRTRIPGDTETFAVATNKAELVAGVAIATPEMTIGLHRQLFASLAGRPGRWYARTRRRSHDTTTALATAGAAGLIGVAWVNGRRVDITVIWLAPAAVALALGGIFAAAEHYALPYGPGTAMHTTRTTTTSAWLRRLIWNGNYHTAHHHVPSIPSQHLPRLHELIAERCEHIEATYRGYYTRLWNELGNGIIPAAAPFETHADATDTDRVRPAPR